MKYRDRNKSIKIYERKPEGERVKILNTEISRNMAYGVSSKYEFGSWNHVVYGPFASEEQAQRWLHSEGYNFRERELMSKTAAIKLAGKKAVDRAIDPTEEEQIIKWQNTGEFDFREIDTAEEEQKMTVTMKDLIGNKAVKAAAEKSMQKDKKDISIDDMPR